MDVLINMNKNGRKYLILDAITRVSEGIISYMRLKLGALTEIKNNDENVNKLSFSYT